MEREKEIYDVAGVSVGLRGSVVGVCVSRGNCREVIGGSKWLIGDRLTWK